MPLPPAHTGPSDAGSDPALRADASAQEWSDWANYIHALRPGWIGIRLQATARVDAERADDRARKPTAMYFDDRASAHAMVRGKTCTTSPLLRAVPLHAHYAALFRGSVFTEHDAIRHVTRGTFTDYGSFLAAALADQHTGGCGILMGYLRFVRARRIGAPRSAAMDGNGHQASAIAGTAFSPTTRPVPRYTSAPS